MFFAGQTLQAAVGDAARLIMTGQAQTAELQRGRLQDQVCTHRRPVRLPERHDVDVKTTPVSARSTPTSPINNGQFDTTKIGYTLAGPATSRSSRCTTSGRSTCSLLGDKLSNLNGSNRLLLATSVFQQRALSDECMLMTRALFTLSRLARDRRGVSAVEFALVAPLMIGLYLGCVEISDGVAADRKVTLTARPSRTSSRSRRRHPPPT